MSRRDVVDIYPLTPMQLGMLFHALAAPDEPVYRQQYVTEITGVGSAGPIRAALSALVARHAVLRTGFSWETSPEPLQVVFARAALTVEDASDVDAVLATQRATPFDLHRPPLLQAALVPAGPTLWRLVTTHHHLVLDGWSIPLLHDELRELLAGAAVESLPPARPFGEFVRWLRHREAPDPAEHYAAVLGDVTAPTPLGVDRVGRVSGSTVDWDRVAVERHATDGSDPESLARARGLLPSTLVNAAWALLLARCAGTDDALFGLTVSGRPADLPDAARRIGMFVNSVPLRLPVPDDQPAGDWLRSVQAALIEARDYEQVPVSVAQRASGVPAGTPLFETVVAFQNFLDADDPEPGDGVDVIVRRQVERTSLPIAVAVALPTGAAWVRLDYDRARLDRAVATRLAQQYADLILTLSTVDERRPVGELAVATGSDAPAVPAAEPLADLIRPGARVVAALDRDDPAYEPLLAAVDAAGAHLDLRDPLLPGTATGADLAVGPASSVDRLAGAAAVAVVGDPPPIGLLRQGIPVWRVHRAPGAGVVGCARVDTATALGDVPGGRLLDRGGRAVPDGVIGELAVGGVRTGLWGRRDADERLVQTGPPERPAEWLAGLVGADPAVAAAVVTGSDAWVVPADGADPATLTAAAITARLRDRVPPALLPDRVHVVPWLPVDVTVAPVAAPPAPGRPTPLGDRLATRPGDRRTRFLDGLRTAERDALRLRPRRRADPPASVQQEQWARLRDTALREIEEPAGQPAGAGPGELTYGDYACWQRDPRRTADRAEQEAYWRTALAGAPVSGVPADRVPNGLTGVGTATAHVPTVEVEPAPWLAAAALVLAAAGRDDDVVVGVVTRPDLPAELAAVPGPYDRMLPVRLDPAGGVEAAGERLAEARAHGDTPWPVLADLLAERPYLSLAVHDRPGALAGHAGAAVGVDVAPDGDGSRLTAVYDRGRVTPETAAALLDRIGLAVALLRTGEPVAAADLTTRADRDTLLAWADGGTDHPTTAADQPTTSADQPATLPELVAARTAQRPDAIAVAGPDGTLTYAELAERSGWYAGALLAAGIDRDDRVAVCLPRTTAMVAAALGVLRAGAAYVPIDATYPQARIEFTCADAGVAAVLTTDELAGRFTAPVIASDPTADPGPGPGPATPTSAAYVIYTSGSTGTPKGVVVPHAAITDFCRQIATAYHLGPDSRLLGFAALTFDVSAFDLWASLTSGATLVLAGDDDRRSAEALQRLMVDRAVTAAELPPGLMPLLDPSALPDLTLVSVGGEAPPGALVDAWATPAREFWNGYGPSETAVAVTLMRCEPPSGGRVPPIGRPMVNHRAYVLDDRSRLVPPGVPGELCIAGAGLARGYLGRPDLTAAAFVPDPYGGTPGARMYRTGDLARWLPNGTLEFLGRVDRQVKVRGFRIELGEVEAAIAADPRVRLVAVEPWDDEDGTRHLVAYVVPADPAAPPLSLPALHEAVADRLPDYMRPTRLARLDALPFTPSGKVDRRALPAPERDAVRPATAPPSGEEWTETERVIAEDVFGPLLKLSAVGRTDDFFALGGNSLQAMQVASRLRDRFGVELVLTDFFAEPTVARLATLVEEARGRADDEQRALYGSGAQAAPRPTMEPGTVLPLSYPQQALYAAVRADGANPGYHAPFALRLAGAPLDLDAVRRAVEWSAARHATLRVTFTDGAEEPVQQVHAPAPVPFEVVDTDPATIGRAIREEAERPFDLGAGPLLRVRIHRLGPEHHVVQWTVHHMVTDGWSVGVQLREIGDAYHAFAAGEEPSYPPLEASYADFVAWHRDYVGSQDYIDDLGWWREQLAGLPGSLGLPTPVERAGHSFRHGWRNIAVAEPVAAAVEEMVHGTGSTLYMITLAAYAIVLAADAGTDDVAIVTPNALRRRSEWEELVGWFVNRMVVRLRVDDALRLPDFLAHVRSAGMQALVHQNVPFELLRTELSIPATAVAAHFSVQNAPTRGVGFHGFDLDTVFDDSGRRFAPIMEVYSPLGARFEVSMMLRVNSDGLGGGLEYDAALFDDARADRWQAAFEAVLHRITADPDVTVAALRRVAKPASPTS